MIRIVFGVLLAAHGLIHLLGFAQAWGLAEVDQLSGKTLIPLPGALAKVMGVLWLVTGLLLVAGAVFFLLRKEGWWMLALPVVVVSQGLIVLYWPEAKFGTLANGIALLAIGLAYGSWRFHTMVEREQQAFLLPARPSKTVTDQMLTELPGLVQKWLRRSGVIGKPIIQAVHLEQHGQMRTHPAGNWMPVAAQQYFTVDTPGFLWIADVKAYPLVHLAGRDKYQNGRGHMLIKLLSVLPVADARGKEIDQGTMLRYLAETVWFPTAALSEYITWEALSPTSARATMRYGGITAQGVFRFNSAGDVVSFQARRYYDRKEGPTLENWLVTIDSDSYREFAGIRIPVRASVTWQLETGDFTWYKLEIMRVVYNGYAGKPDTLVSDPIPATVVDR